MRRGAVPLSVALSNADEASIAHVYRDKQLLALFRGHRTLADYIAFHVDVIVDSFKMRAV